MFDLATRPSEQLLIDALPSADAARVLCTSLGRAQFAAAVASRFETTQVCCHFLDLYQAQQSQQSCLGASNLDIICQADLPVAEFDLVAFPLTAQGDAELTRDWLQAGHQSLRLGGSLWASTDNPTDRWLQAELTRLFDKVTRDRADSGVLYRAVKTGPLKKVKNFACQFAVRDRGQLLQVMSRPGVFSHRRIDTGARALIEGMEVRPGNRVLDLGCGSGVVSLAAAVRAEDVQVLAIDSNPRAVQCTERGAALNGLSNIRVVLDADAVGDAPGCYDLALANPPYFSRYRIAEIFLNGAARALKPGGTVIVVTKDADWYCEAMTTEFLDVEVAAARGYFLVSGRR